jgi:hypothetical protein
MSKFECTLYHDDGPDGAIDRVNNVLAEVGQAFAFVEDPEETDTETYRLISRGTDDWAHYMLKGHVLRRPYTKQERANFD